jgi:hypothetical protein
MNSRNLHLVPCPEFLYHLIKIMYNTSKKGNSQPFKLIFDYKIDGGQRTNQNSIHHCETSTWTEYYNALGKEKDAIFRVPPVGRIRCRDSSECCVKTLYVFKLWLLCSS